MNANWGDGSRWLRMELKHSDKRRLEFWFIIMFPVITMPFAIKGITIADIVLFLCCISIKEQQNEKKKFKDVLLGYQRWIIGRVERRGVERIR